MTTFGKAKVEAGMQVVTRLLAIFRLIGALTLTTDIWRAKIWSLIARLRSGDLSTTTLSKLPGGNDDECC